jgi:hypothetical protein
VGRVVEELDQEGRGQVERRVCHHPERLSGQRHLADVSGHDVYPVGNAGPVERRAKPSSPHWITLDGHHPGAGQGKRYRHRAGTGTHLDDQLFGFDRRRPQDALDDPLVNEEVLAEAPAPLIASGPPSLGGHGSSPLSRSSSWA